MEKKTKTAKDRKTLTLFLFVLPSVLIAMSTYIQDTILRMIFQVVLVVFQSVLIKSWLDSYYGEEDDN